VRCGRCGNENDGANRFCGMCGASLVATTAPAGRAQAASAPPESVAAPKAASVPAPPVPAQSAPRQSEESAIHEPAQFRRAKVEPHSAPLRSETRTGEIRPTDARPSAGPVITGHSFLGLSTPGPAVDRRADPEALRPSSNVDYLLDDEEEPKRGWGKLVLIVVALGLAVGLGYLHFKEAGFDGLTVGDKKSVATKPTSDSPQTPDSGAAAGPATANSAPSPAGVGNNGTASAAGSDAVAPAQPAAQAPAQSVPSQPAPSTLQPAPASPTPADSAPAQAVPSQAQPGDPSLPAGNAPPAASSDHQPAPTTEAPPAAKAAVPAPAMAKPTAAKPIDPVTNAERYIYGRGVRQDCDHGLRVLKRAAEESNAKAMISMGALYSTGTCTPRDLPTAYRWFALALRKEPDNQALQDDLQKLWSQMTQPERQLAIKLSQ
jgi:hypothetical protein